MNEDNEDNYNNNNEISDDFIEESLFSTPENECPICSTSLKGKTETEKTIHINSCLDNPQLNSDINSDNEIEINNENGFDLLLI